MEAIFIFFNEFIIEVHILNGSENRLRVLICPKGL